MNRLGPLRLERPPQRGYLDMIPNMRAEAPDAKEPIGSLHGRCVIVSVSEIGLAKSYRAKTPCRLAGPL